MSCLSTKHCPPHCLPLPCVYFLPSALRLSCRYSYIDASLSNYSFDFISVKVLLCELIQLCLLFLVEVLPVRIFCSSSLHFYISGYICIANNVFLVTCEVLTVLLLKVQIIWDVMLCPWASSSFCFRGSYCLHCQGEAAWPWRFRHYSPLGNIRKYLPKVTACPRRRLLPCVSLLQANTQFIECLLRHQRRKMSGSNAWGERICGW